MSLRKDAAGFTLVEMLVGIVLMAIISLTFLVFFKSSLFNYINLQSDASSMTQLDTQLMRVAQVVRGATNVNSVAANDIVMYSYFYPQDSYVSLVHYYLQTSSGTTKLLADVTPMTSNPPTGTPLTANLKTYTIIDNYYQASGVGLFNYLDASGSALNLPITDLQTVKAVQVTLATKLSNGSNQTINVQVALRNRKTNL
jgi:prepilin-type N-terminal cleavage/methylation domain-containing protein